MRHRSAFSSAVFKRNSRSAALSCSSARFLRLDALAANARPLFFPTTAIVFIGAVTPTGSAWSSTTPGGGDVVVAVGVGTRKEEDDSEEVKGNVAHTSALAVALDLAIIEVRT